MVETIELKERGSASTNTGCSVENVRAGSVGVAATGETAGSFCLGIFLTGIFKRWLLRPILGALRSIVHSFSVRIACANSRQSALRKPNGFRHWDHIYIHLFQFYVLTKFETFTSYAG
jgi:hypothetical protein